MDSKQLVKLTAIFGDAFYMLNSDKFKQNYLELKQAFIKIYPNFNIAYSYKTNYTPKLCKIVDDLGGYAEVVSDMEMELALNIGCSPEKIIWNGPYKNYKKVQELLLNGGTVNIDSVYEIELIRTIAKKYASHTLNIGIRVNFDVNDGVISRFGFDVQSTEFQAALNLLKEPNLNFKNLQCHFATRSLETWRARAEGMLNLLDSLDILPDIIDLGGGLFGKMPKSLRMQFDVDIPSYDDYAELVATLFKEYFQNSDIKPMLLIEPGSALVGDCMDFVSKVINIKKVRDKYIATLLGSIYNINPTLNKKNPPIFVYSCGGEQREYTDLDFGGFTCIETDYLYRHFKGKLAVGDFVSFGNVGSYSIVLKPPFILPNFPIIEISGDQIDIIKHGESFDDIFHTYKFNK